MTIEIPIEKAVEIPTMAIVVRAVLHENNKYNPQVFLDDVCIRFKNGE